MIKESMSSNANTSMNRLFWVKSYIPLGNKRKQNMDSVYSYPPVFGICTLSIKLSGNIVLSLFSKGGKSNNKQL